MPLVRVEVRNEYGLGMPELYTETNREDPKAVLDGVAVAGLVGILRQLGDLAEFAAEVFHGLQEQVLITSSRSHKLVERVHNIEAALPPLEKAILAQRSHLHFAYTAGSHWHTRLRTEQNHFIYSDLPRCIMDSYEDCRDPPRLHKLDKFDIGGPGSCFRRYSDPTYFKRTSAGPYEAHLQSVPRVKKTRRSKKKKSSRYRDMPLPPGARTQEKVSLSLSPTPSQFHVPETSGNEREVDRLNSFDSRNGSGYIECIFRPSYSTQSEDNNIKEQEPEPEPEPEPSSYLDSASIDDNNGGIPYEIRSRSSPFITWDEKLEIIDSTGDQKIEDDIDFGIDNVNDNEPLPPSVATRVHHHHQPDEIESETDYYLDALNTIESESETDLDCQTKRELNQNQHTDMNNKDDNDDDSKNFEFHVPEVTSSSKSGEGVIELNQETSPPVAGISSVSDITPENTNIDPLPKPILTTTHESPKPPEPPQLTSNQPVMFWTNGGLLGLEPSKPPDFGQKTINEDKDTVVDTSKPESTDKSEEKEEDDRTKESINSSRIFEFSNRLLVSGFRRQISLVGNEKLANSVKTDVPDDLQKGQRTITGIPFREQFVTPSSPPLEHMRISFQPIDGFESNSKLKLAFPDGNNSNNTMFPSFQLVPEEGIGIRDSGSGSDSDDDTFCRSSPYASDDCRSHLSESNSDQWDSGDSPGVRTREFDDAFGRLSSSESVSSGVRFQQVQTSQSFDIPNFDSMNGYVPEPTPLPPPLPPMEWRGVKPHSSGTMEEKEDGLPEALSYGLNLTPTNPTLPQQPKSAPTKQEHFVQSKNLHVENENRTNNGKMVDEKEDFLQQIRTKSLNLRRTSTARPTITPAVPTGVKVTAILEKANAIRQVVGSDDGEDDTWSDT